MLRAEFVELGVVVRVLTMSILFPGSDDTNVGVTYISCSCCCKYSFRHSLKSLVRWC